MFRFKEYMLGSIKALLETNDAHQRSIDALIETNNLLHQRLERLERQR